MPWKESSRVTERAELVRWAELPDRNLRRLAQRFGVSEKTAYKWLARARAGLPLEDRTRRPHTSPRRTPDVVETQVLAVRDAHPVWGPRKIRAVLHREALLTPPALSTIAAVLRRHNRIGDEHRSVRDWQRFEAEAPNELWQMDFKGHIAAGRGRCHPLTVLDDHSRFNVCLQACTDERRGTVQAQLTATFERYGMPAAILTDNGSPWGSAHAGHPYTKLGAWLIRLGIDILHGKPHHPQTQGKEERFHRTLKAEVLALRPDWTSPGELQQAFDLWRPVYNFSRPHEALGDQPPASRYRPSDRVFPGTLPAIEYGPQDTVRMVHDKGRVKFRGRLVRVSHAFIGQPVALRPVADGVWDIYYCHQRVGQADLTEKEV
jgi:transposase InsO family protein